MHVFYLKLYDIVIVRQKLEAYFRRIQSNEIPYIFNTIYVLNYFI